MHATPDTLIKQLILTGINKCRRKSFCQVRAIKEIFTRNFIPLRRHFLYRTETIAKLIFLRGASSVSE